VGAALDLSAFTGLGAVVGVSSRGEREMAATGATVHTPFRIASLTKTFTAAAVVRALRGKGFELSLPVAEILPELDTELTVEQVLAQSSGLKQTAEAAAVAALGEGDEVFLATAKLVVAGGQEYPPGERWAYYNGNYFLAGALLARLSGATFEKALTELTAAAGLTATGFAAPDAWAGLPATSTALEARSAAKASPGAARQTRGPAPVAPYPRARRPSGGLWSSVPDLLSFCEFLLRDKGLLAEIATPRVWTPLAYGLGWAVGPMLYVNGRLPGYRAAMLLSPGDEWAAAMLVDDTDALPAIAQYLDDLQRPLTGVPMARLIDDFAA
jgi:CubicO group peptidase (beta-lactamase class C family)